MPKSAKALRREWIETAFGLTEAKGPAKPPLGAVARRPEVKLPAIFQQMAERAAMVKATEIKVLNELEQTLRRETKGRTARQRLLSVARAYRRFATAQPYRYVDLYSRDVGADPELTEARRRATWPLFEQLQATGIAAARVRPLARTLIVFLHGFVSMEMVSAFGPGKNLERDFAAALRTILREIG